MEVISAVFPAQGVSMKVIDHEPESWFVLVEKNMHYVEVRCTLQNYPFWLLIKLTTNEILNYQHFGSAFISAFARKIQHFPQAYFQRNQPIHIQHIAGSVITEWRERLIHRKR